MGKNDRWSAYVETREYSSTISKGIWLQQKYCSNLVYVPLIACKGKSKFIVSSFFLTVVGVLLFTVFWKGFHMKLSEYFVRTWIPLITLLCHLTPFQPRLQSALTIQPSHGGLPPGSAGGSAGSSGRGSRLGSPKRKHLTPEDLWAAIGLSVDNNDSVYSVFHVDDVARGNDSGQGEEAAGNGYQVGGLWRKLGDKKKAWLKNSGRWKFALNVCLIRHFAVHFVCNHILQWNLHCHDIYYLEIICGKYLSKPYTPSQEFSNGIYGSEYTHIFCNQVRACVTFDLPEHWRRLQVPSSPVS